MTPLQSPVRCSSAAAVLLRGGSVMPRRHRSRPRCSPSTAASPGSARTKPPPPTPTRPTTSSSSAAASSPRLRRRARPPRADRLRAAARSTCRAPRTAREALDLLATSQAGRSQPTGAVRPRMGRVDVARGAAVTEQSSTAPSAAGSPTSRGSTPTRRSSPPPSSTRDPRSPTRDGWHDDGRVERDAHHAARAVVDRLLDPRRPGDADRPRRSPRGHAVGHGRPRAQRAAHRPVRRRRRSWLVAASRPCPRSSATGASLLGGDVDDVATRRPRRVRRRPLRRRRGRVPDGAMHDAVRRRRHQRAPLPGP